MTLNQTVSRVFASAAVVAAMATASLAQQGFSYTTTFTPDPISVFRPGQAAPEFFIDVAPGSNSGTVTPTNIVLANFSLLDNPADPNSNGTFSFDQMVNFTLTIDPDGAAGPLTQGGMGRIFGTVTRAGANTGTINNLTFNMGTFPLFYNFGNGLTFTVSNPVYTPFGGVNAVQQGAVSALVTSTNPIPEPSEYAAMGMAGFALCGLMVRARRKPAARKMAA